MNLTPFQAPGNNPENQFDKDLEQTLDKIFSKIRDILNNGLNFSDNFECHVETITTDATPGNSTVITHNLKRTPVGCLVLEKDKAAHIYKSASTTTTYTVKSDVASVTATLVIL